MRKAFVELAVIVGKNYECTDFLDELGDRILLYNCDLGRVGTKVINLCLAKMIVTWFQV